MLLLDQLADSFAVLDETLHDCSWMRDFDNVVLREEELLRFVYANSPRERGLDLS